MNEPIRTQREIRCAFNAYCKRSLMNEKLVAHRDIKRRRQWVGLHENHAGVKLP